MPRRLARTDPYGLLLAADATAVGVSRSTLRTGVAAGRLERPHRGVYRVAAARGEHADVRAAMAHLGPEAVGVIGSAAVVHALAGLPLRWTPQIALPPGLERRQRSGVQIHFWDLSDTDVQVVDDIAVTTVVRTLADACRLLGRERAVCLVDSALDQRLVAFEQFPEILALMARRRDCVAGRRSLGLARAGAQSPGETRIRLILTDAGLAPDALQVELRDERLIGFADLGYALPSGGWLLVEFDGVSVHEQPQALLRDRHRQNAILAQRDSTIVRFAWDDLRRPDLIVATVRPILAQARWRPGHHDPHDPRARRS